jgi:hypothetical protein
MRRLKHFQIFKIKSHITEDDYLYVHYSKNYLYFNTLILQLLFYKLNLLYILY